jgi:hypothetical protein
MHFFAFCLVWFLIVRVLFSNFFFFFGLIFFPFSFSLDFLLLFRLLGSIRKAMCAEARRDVGGMRLFAAVG